MAEHVPNLKIVIKGEPKRGRAAREVRLRKYERIADLQWLIELYESRIRGFRDEMLSIRKSLGR